MSLLFAWVIDAALGEPPAPFHPVVWMGTYLHFARRYNRYTIFSGALMWLGGAALVLGVAFIAQWLISLLPFWVGLVLTALCLKPLFAWRALRRAAESVLNALDPSTGSGRGLATARNMLAWHLVSRDTSDLSAGEVCGAIIESVAENFSDSVVAPLLYFLIGGLPLAALYRYINTADALWGYRTPELEHFGKTAARADDVFNFIPSRLSAPLLCVACLFAGLNAWQAFRLWRRDARLTPSPNAGQTMSAASGALGVQLSKRGLYVLGAEFREPTAADARQTIRLADVAAWLFVAPVSIANLLVALLTPH